LYGDSINLATESNDIKLSSLATVNYVREMLRYKIYESEYLGLLTADLVIAPDDYIQLKLSKLAGLLK